MSIILTGGPFDAIKLYVGPVGELIFDSSNWDLLLADNATPGGHRFQSQANADERYQAKDGELDGLTGFEPQEKGFLVRLGAGDYRIRTLTVNTDNLTVTNPKGYLGDPLIELAETINSEHTWAGDQTFTGAIVASGGITGDVTGDLTGDVTGNVTGNLTGNSVGTHTGPTIGDVDVRGATLLLDDGQIHLAALNADVVAAIALGRTPVGGIIIWSGSEGDIPDTFRICDGTNGTPDLTDRFVVGAGGAYDVDEFGGSSTHTPGVTMDAAGAHTHTLTIESHVLTVNEMPAHVHGNSVGGQDANAGVMAIHGQQAATASDSISQDSHDTTIEGLTESAGGGAGHTHDGAADSAGSHTHTLHIAEVDHRPMFYALCYIMRVS